MAKAKPSSVPVQQKLYEWGKPALHLVRIIGYFPFSVSKNFGLSGSYRSIPFMWSTFLCVIALLKIVNLCARTASKAVVPLSDLDKVEAFCQLLLATAAVTAVFSFTLKGIVTLKQAVNFWNTNCSMLQEFTDLHPSFNFCLHSNPCHEMFQKIAFRMKFPCIFIWLYGIITPAVMFLAHISPLGVRQTSEAVIIQGLSESWVSMTIKIAFQASISMTYLYMSLTAYMAFFLMVYSACLKIIATELKKLSHQHSKDHLKLSEKSLGSLYSPFLEACIQETQEVDIRICLRAYQLIEDLVAEFNSQFSFEIIVDACKSVSSILVYAFFVITRGVGPLAALVTLGPAIAMGFRLLALATEATEVKKGADAVACELQRLDMDKLTAGTRVKVWMLNQVILCSE